MGGKGKEGGYKVTSVRSLACGQATAPKEDKQGAQRWWAVREGVCHGGARECAMSVSQATQWVKSSIFDDRLTTVGSTIVETHKRQNTDTKNPYRAGV